MQNKEFLGTAPIGKLLFKMAIPTVLAQLVNMLYNIVDRIFIGHIEGVGDAALTGVGICMPLIMAVSAFAALISAGGAPRASIKLGEGKQDEAERILGNCFSLQLVVSAILTAALLIFNEKLLWAFGASENTIGYATQYMDIYALGTVFVQLTLGMNAYITAQGATKVSMTSVLIGAVCNIALDPIFIYGLGLGVKGAALATAISQMASCLWALTFLFSDNSVFKIKKQNLKIEPKVIFPCIALGLAPFIMQMSESVISVCFNSSLQEYGGDIAVGAMTILTSVMQFAMLPLQGVAQGAQPITSYNYGAGNKDRVKKSFFLLLKVSLIYSLSLWACIMLFPTAFAGIFTDKPELIEFTGKALRIYCGALGIFGIQIAAQMTFISLGKAFSSIIVAVVRKFVLLLPLIYIVPQLVENKTTGVYLAEPIADILAVTFTAILFILQFRKALKEMDNK
ncbi:MAG: MATE family efflux transporter [Clostridia bacterium]|nr:MATE family efflux transporter [Clostridia bacterium]